jgi:hypothetical protein
MNKPIECFVLVLMCWCKQGVAPKNWKIINRCSSCSGMRKEYLINSLMSAFLSVCLSYISNSIYMTVSHCCVTVRIFQVSKYVSLCKRQRPDCSLFSIRILLSLVNTILQAYSVSSLWATSGSTMVFIHGYSVSFSFPRFAFWIFIRVSLNCFETNCACIYAYDWMYSFFLGGGGCECYLNYSLAYVTTFQRI